MAENDTALEWRPVQGYPDYEVREDGVVRRVTANQLGRFKGHIMTPNVDPRHGHMWVALRRSGGRTKSCQIGNILARAFLGPPPTPKHQAAHNDGNPQNNHWRNIRWATPMENQHDRRLHGTTNAGEKQGSSILTEKNVREIKQALLKPYRGIGRDLGAKYGVAAVTISDIRTNRKWKHVK